MASIATGRIDAMVFVVGFLGGSILFGDLFPVWSVFYNSDYRGVFRLDELFGMNIGSVILIMTITAVVVSLFMRLGQHLFWPAPSDQGLGFGKFMKYEAPLVALALVMAVVLAFFPTDSFLRQEAPAWYIIQKQAAPVTTPMDAVPPRVEERLEKTPASTHAGDESC
jgi:hypothetical protein